MDDALEESVEKIFRKNDIKARGINVFRFVNMFTEVHYINIGIK